MKPLNLRHETPPKKFSKNFALPPCARMGGYGILRVVRQIRFPAGAGRIEVADTKTGETEDDRKESEDEAEYKWSGYRLRQFNFSPLNCQTSLIHLVALSCDWKTKGNRK